MPSTTPEDVIVWALEQRTFDRMPDAQKAAAIMREFAFNGYTVVKAAELEQLRAECARVAAVLAEHELKYLNHPPGPGSNFALLTLCEDTIAAVANHA